MALKIRLARGGSKKHPFYRIVVAEASSPRDGRFVERLGSYDPMVPKDHENRVSLKDERIKFWMSKGAKPTLRVHKILAAAGLLDAPIIREQPIKAAPGKKRLERENEAKEAAEAPAEAAPAEAPAEATPAEAPSAILSPFIVTVLFDSFALLIEPASFASVIVPGAISAATTVLSVNAFEFIVSTAILSIYLVLILIPYYYYT